MIVANRILLKFPENQNHNIATDPFIHWEQQSHNALDQNQLQS